MYLFHLSEMSRPLGQGDLATARPGRLAMAPLGQGGLATACPVRLALAPLGLSTCQSLI